MKTADPQALTRFHSCRNSDGRLELSINGGDNDDYDDNRRNLWRRTVRVNLALCQYLPRDALHGGEADVTTTLTASASF